jgi:hypothetical protein
MESGSVAQSNAVSSTFFAWAIFMCDKSTADPIQFAEKNKRGLQRPSLGGVN